MTNVLDLKNILTSIFKQFAKHFPQQQLIMKYSKDHPQLLQITVIGKYCALAKIHFQGNMVLLWMTFVYTFILHGHMYCICKCSRATFYLDFPFCVLKLK